jgi:NADH dehydrogenase
LAGKNILAVLGGREPRPYTYRSVGELVSLGHRSGVGTVFGIMVRGFPAWWLWRTYYLMRLPTALRRVRVALDWTVDLLFQKDVVELPMARERSRPPAEVNWERSGAPPPPAPAGPR